MEEVIEVGSPDSGYMTNSPQSVESDRYVFSETYSPSLLKGEEQTLGRIVKKSQEPYDNLDARPGKQIARDLNGTQESHDGKAASCYEKNEQEDNSDSAGVSPNPAKNIGRKRKTPRQISDIDETSSPVLGIRILPMEAIDRSASTKCNGDSDPEWTNAQDATSQVELLDEGGSPGKFTCRLCSKRHSDALQLAQHRCPRIVNIRYECSECGKIFGCPANLASHKRWHKPKGSDARKMVSAPKQCQAKRQKLVDPAMPGSRQTETEDFSATTSLATDEVSGSSVSNLCGSPSPRNDRIKAIYSCPACKRRFRREANCRKHAFVKHGISVPATGSAQTPLLAGSSQKSAPACGIASAIQASSEMSTTKMALPSVTSSRENEVGKRSIASGCQISYAKEEPTRATDGSAKPLDLTVKSKQSPLRHSVAEIMKPEKLDSRFPSIQSYSYFASKVNNVADGLLPFSCSAFVTPTALASLSPLFANPYVSWSAKPNPHIVDYQYLAALRASDCVARSYRS